MTDFKPHDNWDELEPFKTKKEVEEHMRGMQKQFNQAKRLIAELEDAAFVCICKTQKACMERINEIKKEKG